VISNALVGQTSNSEEKPNQTKQRQRRICRNKILKNASANVSWINKNQTPNFGFRQVFSKKRRVTGKKEAWMTFC